jgi:1-acyl-sn-glycerol-3-phosphate acyltransferase
MATGARRTAEFGTNWARRRSARAVREAILQYVLGPIIDRYTHPEVVGSHWFQDLPYPVVLAANHGSHLDTPVLLRALPTSWRRRTVVVAAADYFYSSRMKGMLVSLAIGAVPIERKGPSKASTERISRLLGEGWNILLYPEGTRSRGGRIGKVKSGAARLALAAGVPIMPVYLRGTRAAMPAGSRWLKRHPVQVFFGAPLVPGPDETPRSMTNRLQAALEELE